MRLASSGMRLAAILQQKSSASCVRSQSSCVTCDFQPGKARRPLRRVSHSYQKSSSGFGQSLASKTPTGMHQRPNLHASRHVLHASRGFCATKMQLLSKAFADDGCRCHFNASRAILRRVIPDFMRPMQFVRSRRFRACVLWSLSYSKFDHDASGGNIIRSNLFCMRQTPSIEKSARVPCVTRQSKQFRAFLDASRPDLCASIPDSAGGQSITKSQSSTFGAKLVMHTAMAEKAAEIKKAAGAGTLKLVLQPY
jgi:hypothetical protein